MMVLINGVKKTNQRVLRLENSQGKKLERKRELLQYETPMHCVNLSYIIIKSCLVLF